MKYHSHTIIKHLVLSLFFCITLLEASDKEAVKLSKADQLLSQSTSLVNFDGLSSIIVHDAVNTMTGGFLESGVDLILAGSEPLIFERRYCSSDKEQGNMGSGWNHNQGGSISKQSSDKHCHVVTKGSMGQFVYSGKKDGFLDLNSKLLRKGVTNCISGIISGRTNLKNNSLFFYDGDDKADMTMGSGHTLYYEYRYASDSIDYFGLRTHKKRNHHRHHYQYYSFLGGLKSVSVTNRPGAETNQFTFTQVTSDDVKKCFKKKELIHQSARAKNGQWVNYTFKVFSGWKGHRGHHGNMPYLRRRLIKVESSNHLPVNYDYEEHTEDYLERITRKNLPDGRFLEIEYHKTKDKVQNRKVKCLFAPGVNDDKVMIYQFEYSKQHNLGKTSVYDANRHLTTYEYWLDPNHLHRIARYKNPADGYYSLEEFHWGREGSKNEGNLKLHLLRDQTKQICSCRYYRYDPRGNVQEDWLMGNLRGVNENSITLKKAHPDPQSSDCLIKKSQYSGYPMNLLVESTLEGVTTLYEYHEESDLVKSKYLVADGQIRQREFSLYDDNAAINLHIVDDGTVKLDQGWNDYSGVHERKITYTENRTEAPFGLPRVISEYVWKKGKETLVGKKENHHDHLGQITQQDIYDNENRLAYSLKWEYDRLGNIVKESNALGEVTTREYDLNGNLVSERGPNPKYYKRFEYDKRDRLVVSAIVNEDGRQLITRYGYDDAGNKTSETDISGNTTSYEYDELNRVIKVTMPPVIDEDNTIYYPQTRYEYDIFGHVTAATDPRNLTTRFKNTITGKPYLKEYPDGTKEQFQYSLKGELVLEVKTDGSSISYTYDYDSRPTLIQYFDNNHNLIKTIHKKYDAFRLIQEIEDGIITDYEYDSVGHPSIIRKNGQIASTYTYDPLGREIEIIEGSVRSFKDYDLLNRVIREGEKDLIGHNIISQTCYSYDPDGNRISVKKDTQTGVGETFYCYNALGQVISSIDPYQRETTTGYQYDWLNDYGAKVICSLERDPLGNQTMITRDSNGRIDWIRKANKEGATLQQSQYRYDRSGNKARHIERVITPNKPDKLSMHAWIYDSRNRLKEMNECVAEENQKVTYYTYDARGNLTKVVQPNGVSIHSRYNSLDQPLERESSDGTIHESYSYNDRNLLERVLGLNGETFFLYDENNHLKEEHFANDLQVRYERDILGRINKLFYTDNSFISLTYESSQLKQIRRYDASGQELYVTSYHYDLAGNLIKTELPGNLGSLQITYDLMSRPLLLEASHWKEEILSYDPAGNIKGIVFEDLQGKQRHDYGYDDLSQLILENGHHYTYDSTYNLINKDNQPHLTNEINQLLHDGEVHYTYDLNGNLISDQTNTYSYDALNRLTIVKNNTEYIEYTYDHLNRRLTKRKQNQIIRFFYTGQNEIGSVDKHGQSQEIKILGQGLLGDIGATSAIELKGKVYIPLHDHRGNIALLLDKESATTFESYHYTAFGEEISSEQPLNPWRFSSKRVDPETSFVYFGERYYSPKIRRWITRDPINFEGGINFYAYVENNPLTYCDPIGCFALPTFDINPVSVLQGGLQVVGGLSEMAAGSILAATTGYTGVGLAGGLALVGHGFDNVITGTRQMCSDTNVDTATTQLLEKTGIPHGIATTIDSAIGMGRSQATKMTTNLVNKTAKSLASTSKTSAVTKLRSLTRRNFRENLSRLTNKRPGKGEEAHHVFPQKYEDEFNKAGIHINDPQYGAWWEKSAHRSNAYQYNEAWERHLKNPKSKEEILEIGKQMMNRENIKTNF